MDARSRLNPVAAWRRLTLWPRLAIGVTVGFLLLWAGFTVLGVRALDASTNRILHERLAITEELAEDFDGLLEHRFADLQAFDTRPASPALERRLLTEVFRASSGEFTTLALLDAHGRPLQTLGGTARPPAGWVPAALAARRRSVSAPFRDGRGRAVVALAVPVRTGGLLVATLDLAGPDFMERLDAAKRLGTTGHAELVGPGGVALASTEASDVLKPGEHLDLYRRMLRQRQPGIADVAVTPHHHESGSMQREKHVMAFVRLEAAPWGVALGGTDSETYAPVRHLRRTLTLAGGGSLAALWLLTLLGARLLVRPVRGLTRAAERMASGDLDETIAVSEGGEIGVLAESLETMRAQLKDSLETVQRWGDQLELEVAERTAELNARNRQLAAVSAILAVANETHELEAMLHRCLEIVLEQTGADAAAVRLTEGREVVERGDWAEFPEGASRLVALPLRGPSGLVGELTLGRRDGHTLPPEEAAILDALCDQLAVAVENAGLAGELRRLEAQQESQRLRSELISAVSHELRTPLGFIKGYATTLLREDTPIDPATRRRFLEIVDEETDKLEHMIDELLDASRLQAGRLPIERRPLLLGDLLARAVEKARPTLEAGGHRLALRLPDEDVPVLADALRIEQVLDNLLENANRYSDPSSPVEVALVAEEGHALLSVRDRGEGVPAGELEQIFQPFYRGGNATRSGVRGAGLGLAICRGIVEAHGGRIWGENGRDRATTFVVTLPLAAA